jgi:hypothetical protein
MKKIKPISLSKVTDPELMILINALSCGQYRPSAPAHKQASARCLKTSFNYNCKHKNSTHFNRHGQGQCRFSH